MERGRGRPPSAAAAALVALISLRAGPLGWIPTAAAAASSAGGHSSSSSSNTSSPGPARADRRLARDLEGQSRALDHDIALDLSGAGADATGGGEGEGEGGVGEAASSSDVLNADDIGLIDSIFGSAMGAADLANGGGGDGAKIPAEMEMEMEMEMETEMDGPSLNAGPAFHPDEAAQQQERHTPPVRYRRHEDEDEMEEEEEQPAAPSAPYGTGGFDDDQDFYDYYDATYADAVDPDRPTADTYEDLDANPASGPTSYSGQDARPAAIKEEAPPPDGPGHGLEDIVRAHREALSRDLDGVTQRPARAAFVPQSRSFPGAGAGAGARAPPVRPSKVPPSYGANLAESSSSNPGPPPPPSSSSPPSNPSAAKRRERARKAEQNLLRTVASEVHTTYTTALSSVIRGDASAHVPAGIFGQSLTEERAGTRLAGLGSEYDVNGMYNYGPYGTEEELRSFSDWSALLHSTSANQCGAVDIKTAEAKLYGGAQYHRCVRSFSALLLTLPLPTVTDEELSLLMAATGSAGSGGGHDGPDLLRTASILCRTKMEGLVRYALDELAGRVEYILGQRCWDCVNYSALIRPASETRTDMINYGSEDSERARDARRRGRVDAEEASERYSDLEDTFRELVRTAYGKFVKENVSRAATMGWTDAMALLRYVSWDMTISRPKNRNTKVTTGSRRNEKAAVKPMRGGAYEGKVETQPEEKGEDGLSWEAMDQASEDLNSVRPVKRLRRKQKAIAAAAAAAAAIREEAAAQEREGRQGSGMGFLSKIRLKRRSSDNQEGKPNADGDNSAYYDLQDFYDRDHDGDYLHEEEDLGDLVGGVLNRGIVGEGVNDNVSGHGKDIRIAQMSPATVGSEGDDEYVPEPRDGDEDEMLSILLRAAAAAASSSQGGRPNYETQTRAAMTALVKHVTDRWRRDLVSLIIGKFNSFCLLGFHADFGAYLRREMEVKLAEYEAIDSKGSR